METQLQGLPVLTPSQAALLAAIDELTLRRGFPPTVREAAARLGCRINCVCGLEHILIRQGFLGKTFGDFARTWRILRRVDGERILIAGRWFRWEPCGEGRAA